MHILLHGLLNYIVFLFCKVINLFKKCRTFVEYILNLHIPMSVVCMYRFTPEQLCKQIEELGYQLAVVIDLTFTFRYYNGANVGSNCVK